VESLGEKIGGKREVLSEASPEKNDWRRGRLKSRSFRCALGWVKVSKRGGLGNNFFTGIGG